MLRVELAAWLRLLEAPGIGLQTARRLLTAAGSPEAVFELPQAALAEITSSAQRTALRQEPAELAALVERTWAWLQADPRHSVLTLGDADYPAPLAETADPPLLLYLSGRRELLAAPAIAIVGSRNPTAQGGDNARAFAEALARDGLCVVSGLALGVDAAAHEGALKAGGATIAVVGTGLDQHYPRRNAILAERIADEGLLLSEYALGTPVLGPNFPRRNRIIAGLSRGCLVVEAALQSGSLITARMAVEAGREVFAIPGSIHSPQSKGCHALIRQGAKLVESAEHVLEELPPMGARLAGATAAAASELPRDQQRVLDVMGFDPVSLDALMARGGWPAAELSAHLLDLELEGRVARLAGQRFQQRQAG